MWLLPVSLTLAPLLLRSSIINQTHTTQAHSRVVKEPAKVRMIAAIKETAWAGVETAKSGVEAAKSATWAGVETVSAVAMEVKESARVLAVDVKDQTVDAVVRAK